jgi:5'-3' exonuclease
MKHIQDLPPNEDLHNDNSFMFRYEKTYEDMLVDLVRIYKVSWKNVVLCLDSPRADIWRFDHHHEYKCGRLCKFNQAVWKYTFESIIPRLQATYGFNTLCSKRLEADDVAAICVETIKEATNDYDIIIITNDNDYLQLYEQGKVVIMNLFKKDISSRLPGDKDPQKYLTIKCITGDKSDFIHSIKKGVGPKTAEMYASNPQAFEAFLGKNPEAQDKYDANRTLIDFTRIPADLKAAAKEQIKLFKDILQ